MLDVSTLGTPKITVRADAELWEAFKAACAAEGVSAAADIREYMKRKVARHKSAGAEAKPDQD